MAERRTSRRFQMNLPLVVRFPEPEGAKDERTCQTRDVSFRGLYFMIEREMAPGAPVEFVLTLPKEITMAGDVHIRCQGRVIRVEKPQPDNKVGVAAIIERYEFLPME